MTLSRHQQTEDVYIPLANEEIVLAVPSLHPACHLAVPTAQSPYPELNPDNIRHEPFAMMYKQSTMYEVISQTFQEYDFSPETLFYAQRSVTALKWYRPASAAVLFRAFLPAGAWQRSFPNVSFFSFPSHPTWTINASYKKGSYLTAAAQYFIQLAREYWGELAL